MGKSVDIVVMRRGRSPARGLLADALSKTLGDGPQPPSAGAVQVRYAGWHVDDGDASLDVGQEHRFRLLLERHEGSSPSDWFPDVSAAPPDAPTELKHLPHAPVSPTYSFVGRVVAAESTGHAHWTAVEAGSIRFAVPGRHEGRLRGIGYLVEDTYLIDSVAVWAAIEQPLRIERIQALRHVMASAGRSDVRELAGWAPPVDVGSTRDRLAGLAGDHTFFIDVRPPT